MSRTLARVGGLLLLIGLLQHAALGGEFRTPSITPEELRARQQTADSLLVVDVRNPAEFRVGHLPGAINIPEPEIAQHLPTFEARSGVVVYCIAGKRTQLAEQTLLDHEIHNVLHLDGGLMAWIDSGFTVEKGLGPERTSSGNTN